MKIDSTNDVDAAIGRRIRFHRNLKGITQEGLAVIVGVSFQQIQKYETGQNKISASNLFQISNGLKTPIEYFFRDPKDGHASGFSDNVQDGFVHEIDDGSEAASVLQAYFSIPDKRKRRNWVEMMKDSAPA